MNSKRRVVITGMGAVSPNGIGREAFTQSILEGRSGVRRISRFDPAGLSVQIAGEVSDFDELAWMEKKERRHAMIWSLLPKGKAVSKPIHRR